MSFHVLKVSETKCVWVAKSFWIALWLREGFKMRNPSYFFSCRIACLVELRRALHASSEMVVLICYALRNKNGADVALGRISSGKTTRPTNVNLRADLCNASSFHCALRQFHQLRRLRGKDSTLSPFSTRFHCPFRSCNVNSSRINSQPINTERWFMNERGTSNIWRIIDSIPRLALATRIRIC